MRHFRRFILFIFLILVLLSCRQETEADPVSLAGEMTPEGMALSPAMDFPEAPTLTAVTPDATGTAVPSPTSLPTITPTPSPETSETAESTPAPTDTPDPYTAYTIESLAGRTYGGGALEILR